MFRGSIFHNSLSIIFVSNFFFTSVSLNTFFSLNNLYHLSLTVTVTLSKINILYKNVHCEKERRQNFLLVVRYFLLVTCYFLLGARYFLLVAPYLLLLPCYFLFVSSYFLVSNRIL